MSQDLHLPCSFLESRFLDSVMALPSQEIEEIAENLMTNDVIVGPSEDNTRDVAYVHAPPITINPGPVLLAQPSTSFIPYVQTGAPSRKFLPNDFNFNTTVSVNKSDGVYFEKPKTEECKDQSYQLNIKRKKSVLFKFTWDYEKINQWPMYVRTAMVFKEESQWDNKVARCSHHANEEEEPIECMKHVMCSARYDPSMVSYGTEESFQSVVVRFDSPDINTQHCKHVYMFKCFNSCPSMNKQKTEIILTLENATGDVYARQIIGVRVCECPFRDMPNNVDKKQIKRAATSCRRRGKSTASKRTRPDVPTHSTAWDSTVYTLPPLQVVGWKAMEAGLGIMKNMMEAAASNAVGTESTRYIAEMQSWIEQNKPN